MSTLSLPEGWRREEKKLSNGILAGKVCVGYISPSGRRFTSKAELAAYLGHGVDLSTFDWATGRISASALMRKSKRSNKSGLYDYKSLKHDPSLTAPVRRSLIPNAMPRKSIEVVTSAMANGGQRTRSSVLNAQQIKEYYKREGLNWPNPKSESNEKPCQVFWHKRLQGYRSTVSAAHRGAISNFRLPPNMKAFMSSIDSDTALRSIAASLLQHNQSIRGQDKNVLNFGGSAKSNGNRKQERIANDDNGSGGMRNPAIFVNPHQPLIVSTIVTEDDIRRQEELVQEARQRLANAIRDLKFH